jgi:MFS family permease
MPTLRDTFSQLSLLANPVLRTVTVASGVNMFGRSAFLTLTVLFATMRIGLPAGTTAIILTIANGVGLVTAAIAGHLADRIPTRSMLTVTMAVEGVALCAVPWAENALALGRVALTFVGANRATYAARSATIAYAFNSGNRAGSRAIVKMANNAAVAIGSSAAAIPVMLDTTGSYRIAFAVAGCATVTAGVICRRLPPITSPARSQLRPAATPTQSRSPFLDLRYLGVTVLSGLLAMQFGVAEVGVPLWITAHTSAPRVLITLAFAINTVLIVILQLPLSRGTDEVTKAAKVTAYAGALMFAACAVYALSAVPVAALAAALLVGAVVCHTLAEIFSSAGTWGLSYELANQSRAGAYQGVFALGTALGGMGAPIVSALAVGSGLFGWCALGAVFLLAGLGIRALAVIR